MPAIPDQLPLDPVQGVSAPADAVAPTDLGLNVLGQQLDGVATMQRRTDMLNIRAQAEQDKQSVMPAFIKVQAANDADYQTAVASGQAGQPGFVGDLYDAALQRAGRFAGDPSLTPGQASQLHTMAVAHANQIAQQAAQVHAQALARPIAQAQQLQQTAAMGDAMAKYQAAFAPAQLNLQNAYVDGDPNYVANVAAAHDQATTAAVAAAPESVRLDLAQQLEGQRYKVISDAQNFQLQHANAGVLDSYNKQLGTLATSVYQAPGSYDQARATLQTQASAMPAALGKAYLDQGEGQLAQSRLSALIENGHADGALQELQAGKYNDVLDTKTIEQFTAKAQAENDASGPGAVAKAVAAEQLEMRAQAALTSIHATGKLPADAPSINDAAAALGPQRAAAYQIQMTQAYKDFAVNGAVGAQSQGQLAATLKTPPPDPSDPNYTSKMTAWQAAQQAAQAEAKGRQNPGDWAFSSTSPAAAGIAARTPGAPANATIGQVISQQWQNYAANPGDHNAASFFAQGALLSQAHIGIDPKRYQIVSSSVAQGLAASVINAPPEGKQAAMAHLAATINGLPAVLTMPDGTTVSPRAILTSQLAASGLHPLEMATLTDFGNNPAALGRVVGAMNNPTLKGAVSAQDAKTITSSVQGALAPYLASVSALPGQVALAQARVDRTVLVAKSYMAQGMNAQAAAQAAAKDLTGQYQFVDGWRVPTSAIPQGIIPTWRGAANVPGATSGLGFTNGVGALKAGAFMMMNQLTANNGANLQPATSAGGNLATQQHLAATLIQAHGKWVTNADDSGLTLVAPNGTAGAYAQVRDRFGRPVVATWGQLSDLAQGRSQAPFATPPPTALRLSDNTPVPAYSTQAAFGGLSYAITRRESHFQDGLTSSQGALGRMQVLPEVVQQYAPRLGLPVDLDRAKNDGDYNTRIGNAYLADLTNHYGASSGAGMTLAAAAYFDGQGNVDNLIRTYGDPRSGQITPQAWVNAIRAHAPKTAAYVSEVIPVAAMHMMGRY